MTFSLDDGRPAIVPERGASCSANRCGAIRAGRCTILADAALLLVFQALGALRDRPSIDRAGNPGAAELG
ncbi:hypothetical protein ACUTAF_15380 [Pseudomonas sp. SP16.1]|uniref:hypothetical protein n=1 Tax=Pseudomonas sp. SP16.1 TaxID=3458854 RepID=UPI004045AEF2